MTILGAYMVPHPPIILPEVGRGEEQRISATIKAYEEVARRIADLKPDTILLTSPHTILYMDYFHISPGKTAQGDFGRFNAPQVKIHCTYDEELVEEVEKQAKAINFPAGTLGERDPQLDHATMIPLYFLNKLYTDYKLVRIGLSGESLLRHYQLGEMLAQAANKLGRKVVFIGSGDLSHKLTKEGPYGFDSHGPQYDKRIMSVMSQGNFADLFAFPDDFCEQAAECGHRSFTIMAGALDGLAVKAEQLSYEGPFGVGYGVCAFTPTGPDESRHFAKEYEGIRQEMLNKRKSTEDPYVQLARATIEAYVSTGKKISIPVTVPKEMVSKRAGTFVSLKEHGQLRGCIGTIGPVRENIAAEIIGNAISASTQDPRFSAVRPEELPDLVYSVDVLGPIEDIDSPEQLDVKRYGVIVTKGGRRGLLLPNLEGVDTIPQQISIACEKAGLAPNETDIKLQRFEVVRHH
jgi:AmmeMemoRadiSam system protein A/AmmeMemoRadiSam system protein B